MSFADNLKTIRKEKQISQEDLAELLDVSRQAVSKWEQGNGYPEVEKMIILSQKLNISLDYLMCGECESFKMQDKAKTSTGKIAIKSHDSKSIVSCYKVISSPIFNSKNDEPKYMLNGINGVSFWGESSTLLGWYANTENIQKEIEAILAALKNGEASYELKFSSKVKYKFSGIKLDE